MILYAYLHHTNGTMAKESITARLSTTHMS